MTTETIEGNDQPLEIKGFSDFSQANIMGITKVHPQGLDKIAGAFAAAQAEMHNPGFDSVNPHFKSKFASLAAVRNAAIPVMARNGICVAQDLTNLDGAVSCETILTHSSGQQMRFGPLIIPTGKSDAHGIGSASTYAKRFALMAVMGVAGDDDDDGNVSLEKPVTQGYVTRPEANQNSDHQVDPQLALSTAVNMRVLLNMDVSDDMKALRIFDKHEILAKDNDLYVAASAQLKPSERKDWKVYVTEAKEKDKADRQVSNVGRRF